MEGRWSGEERTFSFEKCWPTLKKVAAKNNVLKLIESGGRNSQIHNEVGPLLVLSPDQVKRADDGLAKLSINVDGESDEEFTLRDLYPGLQRFFQLANIEEQYVLVTLM